MPKVTQEQIAAFQKANDNAFRNGLGRAATALDKGVKKVIKPIKQYVGAVKNANQKVKNATKERDTQMQRNVDTGAYNR